jgi:hypothetical protein
MMSPYYADKSVTILHGDALELCAELPSSVAAGPPGGGR